MAAALRQIAMAALLLNVETATAETCPVPTRPFIPGDAPNVREYSDLIRDDFELNVENIQAYLRCLDQERRRAFEEARDVSNDYAVFLRIIGD